MSTVVVSASGKVLIAGGYLVLDPSYSGVVVSTSSRFYTVVESAKADSNVIYVKSPQFKDATWNYVVKLEDKIEVDQRSDEASKNKFVHIALQQIFRLAVEIKGYDIVTEKISEGLKVTIVGDNDFYSQRGKLAELGLPPLISSLHKIPPFAQTNVGLGDVHKTGLGSSAALITSLVAALLVELDIVPSSSLEESQDERRALIHNTAQYIHCLAQGKIGSGFDVAAAVFGSQIYTRFDPSVLNKLMSDPSKEPLTPILSPANKGWNYKVLPFKLPPQVKLMLADVDAGSDTPSLVGKVLKWRESKPSEAKELWDTLARSNNGLAKAFEKLSELHESDSNAYSEVVKNLSNIPPVEWNSSAGGSIDNNELIHDTFYQCHQLTQQIRSKMRKMGNLSGVPIEPPEQTELLDACVSQVGVIGVGVPGAGGYDAVWVLVLDSPNGSERTPQDEVEKVWSSWKKLDVSPLSASESYDKGIRLERVEAVPGLSAIISTD